MHLQPTEACSLTDAVGAFEGLLPDALLLDSSANEMAAMIMQELESSINSTEGEEQHAAANGWASLLPAASGTLSPSAAAGCYTTPIDHTCAGAGPIWTASLYPLQQQQQQHDLALTAPAAAGTSSDLAGHSAASGCTAAAAAAAAAPSSSLLHFSQHPIAAGLAGMAGCCPVPLLLPCEGQYPQFTALMQRRDSCAGGSSTLHCASPSSTPAAPAVAASKRRAAQANERRLRQKQADANNAKEQVASLSAKVASLQAKLDSQRGETSQLLARLAGVTSKWQATVLDNASLNARNGELQAQLGEVQHAAAMMQRERDELRRALQQQPALCAQVQQQQQSRQVQLAMLQQQQQQQQVAWAAPGEHGVHHAAGAAHWAQW